MAGSGADGRLERGRALIRIGLYGLLILTPLPFGSVQPWSVLALEIYAGCLGAGSLWLIHRDPESLSRRAKRLLIPGSLLVLIGAFQLVPLPPAIVRLLARPTAEIRDAVARSLDQAPSTLAPLSLSPPDTLDALLRLLACFCVALAAAVSLRERRHLKGVAIAIVVSGGFQGLYGSAEYLSGHQQIFGYVKIHALDSATGTFINRNHFAGYLAMTLPFAIGLLFDRAERAPAGGWRERVLRLTRPRGLLRLGAALAGFLIMVGVFLSYSRGGLAAALVGAIALAVRWRPTRRRVVVLLLVILIPAVYLSWRELRAPGERFLSDRSDYPSLSSRIPVWKAGVGMLPSRWLLGAGYGTFAPAFRLHQPAMVKRRWTHAHNDWLEAAIEGGIVTFLLVLWIAAESLGPPRRSRTAFGRHRDLMSACVLAAISAVAFHSLLDFTLRIPAAAVLCAFLIGASAAHHEGDGDGPRPGVRIVRREGAA